MTKPMLENMNKEQLTALLQRRAGQYAPEWRFEPGSDDPGAAIASLFSEGFCQTVDRFNQLPEKYYVEFLKLLGVQSPSVTPAVGNIQFGVGGAPAEPVRVPKGTQVFAPVEGGDNIIFTTERSIEATGAAIKALYFADTESGRIEQIPQNDDMPFFESAGGPNLQRHSFTLAQNEALTVQGPCRIELYLKQAAGFLEEATAERLADPQFARWSYFDGEETRYFESVYAEHGRITLEKRSRDALCPDEAGRVCIHCEMAAGEGDITLAGVRVKSNLLAPSPADALASGSVVIDQKEGGYCFGRRPAVYGLFYIRSDHVFQKRGAEVNVQLDITPVTYSAVDMEPQYEFNRRIIDKNDAVIVTPDDVYVSEVIWEYYNGAGWAPLRVSGNRNPFSGQVAGDLTLTFTMPNDATAATVNAEEGHYIRARVVHVENYLTLKPRWILPFVREANCQYQYPEPVPVSYLRAENNHETAEIEHAADIADLALRVYAPMPRHPRAMYLCFDASPHAMPLSILFEVIGRTRLASKLLFEVWTGKQFTRVRAIDGTQNLYCTGLTLLYLNERLTEGSFFGQSGHWLRISLSGGVSKRARMPHVGAMTLNVAPAIQSQKATTLFFDTGPYEAGKLIELIESPVLDCAVWIDEALTGTEEAPSDETQEELEYDEETGSVKHRWVKWQAVPFLGPEHAGQRVYTLDAFAGRITFGSGANGRVPPKGDGNIRVDYSHGGGERGNLEAGRVSALVGSIAKINSVTNPAPMCGGAARPGLAKIERYGNKRFRHRHSAVSGVDFEEIVLEEFQRVAHAKCFSAMNETGEAAPGHVCLVLMGRGPLSEGMTLDLCREVYDYLAPRSDANLIAAGRLHVVPSVEITVNVEVSILVQDLDEAAITQQQVSDAIAELIDNHWRTRDIGAQIDIAELYGAVKAVPNVLTVNRILPEGVFQSEGRRRVIALDDAPPLPLATAKNGVHTIKIG